MRRLPLCSALVFAAALDACSPAPPKGDAATEAARAALPKMQPAASRGRRIELVNNARRGDLVRFEVAPIEDRENFREVNAARGLPADAERRVMVGPGCVYDMRAVMVRSAALLVKYRVDVCFNSRIFLLDFPAQGEEPQITGMGAPPPEPMNAAPVEADEPQAAPTSAPPPPGRGIPTCPGDPRCRKK
jgi:hypothetical protein